MGRGRPKKKVAMTPPTSVRVLVFSSIPCSNRDLSNTSDTSEKGTTRPILEVIVEEISNKENKGDVESPKPWVDIIKGNRLASNGCTIEYTAHMLVNGEIEVHIEEHDVASEKHF